MFLVIRILRIVSFCRADIFLNTPWPLVGEIFVSDFETETAALLHLKLGLEVTSENLISGLCFTGETLSDLDFIFLLLIWPFLCDLVGGD